MCCRLGSGTSICRQLRGGFGRRHGRRRRKAA
jgi:hypothetical protein